MAEIDRHLINRSEYAVLHVPLSNRLTADTLSQVVAYLSDIYSTALWLNHAGTSLGLEPFPDYYDPAEVEELSVLRLEIGTPNFIEILGRVEYLVPVLASLAGALGVATAAVKIFQPGGRINGQNRRAREEVYMTLLLDAAGDPGRNKVERVYVLDVDTDFYSGIEELHRQGRVSEDALLHQARMREIFAYRCERILPGAVGKPTLFLFEN